MDEKEMLAQVITRNFKLAGKDLRAFRLQNFLVRMWEIHLDSVELVELWDNKANDLFSPRI